MTAPARAGLYLAVVLDIGSRRIIGYSMTTHMAAQFVIDAVDAAVATRSSANPNGLHLRWSEAVESVSAWSPER